MTRLEMYRVLGIRHSATTEEIKDAYRRLVKKYHPDITRTNSSGRQLTKVIEAYKTLIVTSRSRNLVEFPTGKRKSGTAGRSGTAGSRTAYTGRTGSSTATAHRSGSAAGSAAPGGSAKSGRTGRTGHTGHTGHTGATDSSDRSRYTGKTGAAKSSGNAGSATAGRNRSGTSAQSSGPSANRSPQADTQAAPHAGSGSEAGPDNQAANKDIFSLGKLLETGKTIGMRAFAARSLGNTGKRTAYAFLRKALYDPSDLVVKTAVEAIGNLKITQSYGELSSVFSHGNTELRETVLAAVEKIGAHGAFRDIVQSAMRDPEFAIRSMARRMSVEQKKAAADG